MVLDELIDYIQNLSEVDVTELEEEDAKLAHRMAYLPVADIPSALVFFAAMNFLNAYVKKPYADPHFRKRYMFKNDVTRGLESLIQHPLSGLSIYMAKDVNYVSVGGLQFSFHNLEKTQILRDYSKSEMNIVQEWTGLRLQSAAKQVFDYAMGLVSVEMKEMLRSVDPIEIFKVLSDPICFSLYQALCKKDYLESELMKQFTYDRPSISHRMNELVGCRLVIKSNIDSLLNYGVNPMAQDQIEDLFEPRKGKTDDEVAKFHVEVSR